MRKKGRSRWRVGGELVEGISKVRGSIWELEEEGSTVGEGMDKPDLDWTIEVELSSGEEATNSRCSVLSKIGLGSQSRTSLGK